MTTPEANLPLTVEPCGGCGETDPVKACLGCRHFFTRPAHPEPERDGADPRLSEIVSDAEIPAFTATPTSDQ